jgi:hypothetical protein
MTGPTPPRTLFAKLALFDWVLVKLRDGIQPHMAILHSFDGTDFSVLSQVAHFDLIAVHQIDAKSEDPAKAFFARFSKSLSRSTRAQQDFSSHFAEIDATEAIHLFADQALDFERPLRGPRVLTPLLAGDVTPPCLPGGRSIQVGSDTLCSISDLPDAALARFKEIAGAQEAGESLILADPYLPTHATFGVPADRLVHDGDYRAERNGNYSWLWTGPDSYFRLMIGKIPFRPALLSVIVAAEGKAGNLQKARVFVNGVLKESRTESWDGGGGRLSVKLDETCSDPIVLSLGAPAMMEAEGRKLGLSIAHLEIGEAS